MKHLPGFVLLLSLCWWYQSPALATCRTNIPESTPTAGFNLSATGGTVVHNHTGLMWSRCSLGQTWNGTGCTGAAAVRTWVQALTEASDWRFFVRHAASDVFDASD